MNARPLPPDLPAGTEILDDGWCQTAAAIRDGAPRPALFLDRDGVIIDEVSYLRRPEDVRLIDGAAALVNAANGVGIPVVLVTNQAGIGRGVLDWHAFAAVQQRLAAVLAEEDARVDGVFACPYHGEAKPPYDIDNHPWRKPNPGMVLAAAERLRLDLGRSWIIGDRATDLEAGRNAGLAGGIHVLTGYGGDDGERTAASALATDGFRVAAASHIGDAPALDSLFPDL